MIYSTYQTYLEHGRNFDKSDNFGKSKAVFYGKLKNKQIRSNMQQEFGWCELYFGRFIKDDYLLEVGADTHDIHVYEFSPSNTFHNTTKKIGQEIHCMILIK